MVTTLLINAFACDQLHSIVFSMFASFISPFGGFYASAIKRTYNLKDFDSVIPGHGGVMDRMDCQLITACFTSVYYNTFIRYDVAMMTYLAGFTVSHAVIVYAAPRRRPSL